MSNLIFPLVIFIYFILVTILIINIHERNQIIKKASILFFALTFVVITFYDETVLEQFIYYILRYIYYPSYYIYMFTILFMVLVFIYSVFNNQLNNKIRVFNYGICSSMIVSYIIFLILNVDVSIYKSLYSGASLICLRLVSRGFIIWLIVTLSVKYYNYFVRRDWLCEFKILVYENFRLFYDNNWFQLLFNKFF